MQNCFLNFHFEFSNRIFFVLLFFNLVIDFYSLSIKLII